MKNNIFVILVASIIGILLLVVGFRTINKPSYKEISFEEMKSVEEGIVYIGKVDKTINKKFKELNKTYDFDLYLVSDYVIDTVNEYLNDNSVNSLYISFEELNEFVCVSLDNGEVVIINIKNVFF